MSLEASAAKPCAHCMQEGGTSRWAALPWGSWDQSGFCQRWTKAQAWFGYSCISDSAFLIFAHTLKSTRFFASLTGSMNPRVSLSSPPPRVVLLSVVLPSLIPNCLKSFVSNSTCPSPQLAPEISVYKYIYKIEGQKKYFLYILSISACWRKILPLPQNLLIPTKETPVTTLLTVPARIRFV